MPSRTRSGLPIYWVRRALPDEEGRPTSGRSGDPTRPAGHGMSGDPAGELPNGVLALPAPVPSWKLEPNGSDEEDLVAFQKIYGCFVRRLDEVNDRIKEELSRRDALLDELEQLRKGFEARRECIAEASKTLGASRGRRH